jgi:heme exporter protein C
MLNFLQPKLFYIHNKWLIPSLYIITIILFSLGFYYGLYNSPIDYQQGEFVRIMYIHVPAAWISLQMIFGCGILSFCFLIWRNNFLILIAQTIAPLGTVFALLTLITGSLWGKPMWGTYWVWDSRLTSSFILFLIYCSLLIFNRSNHNYNKIFAIISILGAINVPIVKFSVEMWNSLHQTSSIMRKEGIAIDQEMLKPLLINFLACISFSFLIIIQHINIKLIKKKNNRNKLLKIIREK